MIISVIWSGFVESENQRHAMRWITRTAKDGGRVTAPVIAPKREYQAFVQNLAAAIMAAARRQAGVRRYVSLGLLVQCTIGPQLDGQNLLKPICDAIQRSRILANDRNIGLRVMLPDERHPQGEADTIHLMLCQLEEARPRAYKVRRDGRREHDPRR